MVSLSKVLADLAYLGIAKICPNSKIPNKKTKKNPLTKDDKKENRKLEHYQLWLVVYGRYNIKHMKPDTLPFFEKAIKNYLTFVSLKFHLETY